MSTASIQSLIEQVRNETQLHGNTRGRIASLLTQLNSEKLDRPAVESIISEITNLSPLFFDQFGNILSSLTQGWTVQFSDEEYIDSLDGRKVIRKVTGYTGGTGSVPASLSVNIGKYFARSGGFTTVKADATIYETSELLIKEAKQGNAPTPYNAVTYPDGLFEKYQVKSPLTMPNSWGSAVTQAELDANYVFFDVRNGVVTKVLSRKPGGVSISPIFDHTSETKAQGGKQIFNASSILFDKAIMDKSGDSRSEILGFGTVATIESNYTAMRINNTPATNDGYITEITLTATTSGESSGIGFHILEKTGEKNGVSTFKNLTGAILVSGFTAGISKTVKLIEPIPIKAGQYLGIGVNNRFFKGNETTGSSFGSDGYDLFYKDAVRPAGLTNNLSWCYDYKVESFGLTGDEIIKLIKDLKKNGGGGGGNSVFTNAESYGVSADNSATNNSLILNNLVATSSHIVLPKGVIKHNGINFREGVILQGQGINNTTLLNESGTFAIRDLDTQNANKFYNGALIQDLTIDGGNIAENGLQIRNQFYITLERVVFRRFTNFCVHFTGVLTPFFNMVKFQESKNGIYLTKSATSSVGLMQANMNRFTMCYFVELDELCVDIDGASNIVFDQCNFENAGIEGNINTGAIRAVNMSPYGEGTDILLINGWSEGIRGTFLNLSNASGSSVIQNHMIFKRGNGAGTGGTAVINKGCRLLLSGSTKIAGWALGVLTTNGGRTFSDGFAELNGHREETGGTFKIANYS